MRRASSVLVWTVGPGPAVEDERLANYVREEALRFLASLRFRFTLGFS